MNITINENLKKLRREKGNTQEELAEHLGISMQAVSKWERGEGYPDITLLPSIALYYDVTADKLLGMDDTVIETKIKEYDERATKTVRQPIPGMLGESDKKKVDLYIEEGTEGSKKRIAIWREAQKEFPNNHTVLFKLMRSLGVFRDEYFDEIVQIGERLLAESTDNEIRFGAIELLCNAYVSKKDFENAKKYANMAPTYRTSKEMLYGRCLSGEERIKHSQENILSFIGTIFTTFIQDTYGCGLSEEEQLKMQEFPYKIYHLVYDEGDFGDAEMILGNLCRNLINYIAIGNTDKAMDYLTRMADHYVKSEQHITREGEFKHTSVMVNRLTSRENKWPKHRVREYVAAIIEQLEEYHWLDSVRNDERYIAAMNKLKSII